MDKIFSMIGMATKAGKTVSGEFATEKAVKTGKAFLVSYQKKRQTTQRKCFAICAPTMKCQCILTEAKMTWDIPWEKNFVPPWQ